MLTHRWQGARRTPIDDTTTHPCNDASSLRKRSACDCQQYRKPLHRRRFRDSALIDRDAFGAVATRRRPRKVRCADSESRFLAMKKFSPAPASRLIGARQNRFFARIVAADSLARFWVETTDCTSIDTRGHACARSIDAAPITATSASRDAQMPSFDFKRSLTACGLALPPDDFIT